jgi:short-subunit dehydrogenase
MQRVAIITGASSGIGEATARQLAREGYALVLAARSAGAIERLGGELSRAGAPALPEPTDVSQPMELRRLVDLTLARFGRIDVLVNNAGVGETREAAPGSGGVADLTLHTNLLAPIALTRAVLPTMLAQRSGHIVNIGSVASHVGMPHNSSYVASKHGLRGFSASMRRQLLGTGVHVSLISPGFIRTPMTKGVPVPMPGPALIGRAVASVLRRPRREVVAPGFYRAAIWINGALPGLVDLALRVVRRKK